MQFFHDTKRSLLIYDRPSPLVLQHIPDHVRVNGSHVAFKHTLQNSQVLRYLNYPVPPIITDSNYDFPIEPGKKALPHQKVMANFMVLHRRCFNLSDMGTMKTLSTLWAADWLMQQYPKGECRALIVAPLSILERVWGSAIFSNFLSRRTFDILYGDAARRQKILASSKADFLVVNFDGVGIGAHTRKKFELDGLSRDLAQHDDIKIAIVDEASGYRDARTKRHRIARLVIGKRPYLWLLTGTPTPNRPTDAYGLAKMVNNAFGKSFAQFQEESETKISLYKWVARKDGYDKARALLSPAIRFDITDVWKDAPPVTVQQRHVELTPEQKKLMDQLKKDLVVTVKSGTPISAINEAAVRTKFLQISQGAIYDSDHLRHLVDAEPRLREAERVIEETNRKVVIFVNLTSVLELLYKRLSKRWKCVTLNGDVSPKQRSINIKLFEEDENVRIVLADPQTTAHGINEFALVADTALWFSPTDKNELYLQGNRRINRPGQKYPMTIVQLESNKLEQEIYRRLETNTSLQGLLLEMVRKGEI